MIGRWRLRSLSHGLFAGVLVALMTNLALVMLMDSAFRSSKAAVAQRESTLRAVEQLSRETDLLRRLVRAYTATGQARHLLTYYDIYAVRYGDKPAPAVSDPVLYWEEAIANGRHAQLPGQGARQSLVQRMEALQVGGDEDRTGGLCRHPGPV